MNAKDVEIQQLKFAIKELKQKETGYVLILHHSKDVDSHQYSITEQPLDSPLELKQLQELVGGYAEDLTGQQPNVGKRALPCMGMKKQYQRSFLKVAGLLVSGVM